MTSTTPLTSSQTEQPPAGRLPYKKPVLRSISLVADEVLGVGCKTPTGSGSGFGPPCWATGCQLLGS